MAAKLIVLLVLANPAFLVLAPVGNNPLSKITIFFSGCFSNTFAATDKPTIPKETKQF